MRDRMMATDADLTGKTFSSRYRLLRVIGEGGMAAVYEGQDERSGVRVAVKVLRSELTSMVGEERFTREIHIAQQLEHPHIVPLLDSGVDGHVSYFVMQLVRGGTLRHRIAEKAQLTVQETLRITSSIASALAHAHKSGIVHRDIKPENVLLDESHVYVSDFGIARLLDMPGIEQKLSTTGLVIGTPAYMSPEQSVGDPRLDPRSDIYSVGCVMYEMLVGTAPFTGATPQAIAARHMVESPPPLRVVRPNVPRYLAVAIERCLAKAPAERFQSMEELLSALASSEDAAALPHAKRISGWWVTVVLLSAAVVAGAYWKSGGFPRSGAVNRYVVLPFAIRGSPVPELLAGEKTAALLYDAMRPVLDSQLVDRLRLEAEIRKQGTPARLDSVVSLARTLGATRAIWGEVVLRGDSVFVYAQVYDVMRKSSEPESRAEIAFAVSDTRIEGLGAQEFYTQFKGLARRLALNRNTGDTQDLLGTDSKPALMAKLSADSARNNWNLPLALQLYRQARTVDSHYAKASLGIAQISEWLDQPIEDWKGTADEAFSFKRSLSDREATTAEALSYLASKQFPAACAAYSRLLARDSSSFDALFGLGECRLMDDQVVRDSSTLSKFRFRGSYAIAQKFYDQAIKTVPSALRDDRAVAIDRLLRVLPTKNFLRPGRLDGQIYAAPPTLVGESISFAPRPLSEERERSVDSLEVRRQETLFLRNAQRLTEYSALWIREFPLSERAWYAHAMRLERTGAFDGDSVNSALYCIRRARALATDEHLRLQYAIDQLRILTRLMNSAAVKALADSLLDRTALSSGDARLLSRVAALVGNSAKLRTLLQAWKVSEDVHMMDGKSLLPPRDVAIAASDILWYSVTGASRDSLEHFELQLDRELRRWAPANRAAISLQYRTLPALIGFPKFGIRAAHRESPANVDLQSQLQFAQPGSRERQSQIALTKERVRESTQMVSADAACLDVALLAAAGDHAATEFALARLVREVQRLSSSLLADFQAPAMVQRCRPLMELSSDPQIKQFANFLREISL